MDPKLKPVGLFRTVRLVGPVGKLRKAVGDIGFIGFIGFLGFIVGFVGFIVFVWFTGFYGVHTIYWVRTSVYGLGFRAQPPLISIGPSALNLKPKLLHCWGHIKKLSCCLLNEKSQPTRTQKP